MNNDLSRRVLTWILRIYGVLALPALIFVVAPHDWMRAIHSWAELGVMPDTPVVWYLARSTSAFYAILGGLYLLASLDIDRYHPLVIYLGVATTVLGLVLFVVDSVEGMPASWTWSEGPVVIVSGIVMLYLTRQSTRGTG